MCGFHVHSGSRMIISNALAALNLIEHRGPDKSAHTTFQDIGVNVFLGFNRLAINDLSEAGMQPMGGIRNQFTCVFNGEIFNHKKLRKELEQKGYFFKSNSDTEILLYGFNEWGKNLASKLDGQFSFVIFDASSKNIFAFRDPLGEKPLYYALDLNTLIISSEKKCIPASLGEKPSINLDFLQETLQSNFPYSRSETIFNGVSQLRAGHYLQYNCLTEDFKISQYFNFEQSKSKYVNGSEFELDSNQIFASKLIDSLNDRVPEEVPFTIALSGGVDSSLLASTIMREPKFTGRKLDTAISFCFQEDLSVNELSKTRQFADFLDLKLIEVYSSANEITAQLSKAHFNYEEIIPGLSMLLEWEVMRTAKELGYKVILSGQGADELFGGYSYYIPYYLASGGSFLEDWHAFKNVVRWRKNFKDSKQLVPISANKLIIKAINFKLGKIKKGETSLNPLHKMMLDDVLKYSLPRNLLFGDRNGMAHGIEIRHPYLSRELTELSSKIKLSDFLHSGYQKNVMRNYLSKLTTSNLAYAPNKLGFEFPNEWMQNSILKNWILERVSSSNMSLISSWSKKEINELVINFSANPQKYGSHVWPFASAIELMDVFKS